MIRNCCESAFPFAFSIIGKYCFYKIKIYYTMNRFLYLSSALFLSVSNSSCFKDKTDVDKPNLLVIMTDEHSIRTLGCYREHMAECQRNLWGGMTTFPPFRNTFSKVCSISSQLKWISTPCVEGRKSKFEA